MPLDGEIKSAFDELQRTLNTFREKNDRLELEVKKSREDVLTKSDLARVNAAIDKGKDDINQLWKKANRPIVVEGSAEERKIETKANREFAGWLGHADESKAAAARKAYQDAYRSMMRKGMENCSDLERKALTVGQAPSGGFWVEPARSDMIIQKVFETSDMRAIASGIQIGTTSIIFPVDRDDIDGEDVGETTPRSETATNRIGEIEIPVHEMSAKPKVSQNMLDDAVIDVEGWVNGKVGERLARRENRWFVVGDGKKQAKGFLAYGTAATADSTRAWGTLQHIGTGTSGAFPASSPADKLLDLIYAFKAPYRGNLRWVMNRTTLGTIRKFKDGQGNYIMGPRMDADRGLVETIWNYPVSEFADMPDVAANTLSVALGDFRKGYMIVDRQGLRQLRDPYTAAPYVTFNTTKRVGGDVIDFDAIKLLKFA